MDEDEQETSNELRSGILNDFFQAQDNDQPKATRLFGAFSKMIEGGYWDEGDRIPTELELAASLPVGLATVQSALRKLTDEGMIIRKRKAGSFVADPASAGREFFFFRFLADDGQTSLSLTDRHTMIEKISSNGEWSDFLGKHPSFVRIERVLDVGGEFLMFSQLFLSDPAFDALLDMPVSELRNVNFRNVLRDRFAVKSTQSDRRVSFTQLTLEQARHLGCDYGLPALKYDVRQFATHDRPLFFMRTVIPQNSRVLQVVSMD